MPETKDQLKPFRVSLKTSWQLRSMGPKIAHPELFDGIQRRSDFNLARQKPYIELCLE